jgi:hypothetical protein
MPTKTRRFLVIPVILLLVIALVGGVAVIGLEYYATSVLKKEIDQRTKDVSEYVRVDYDSLGVNWLAFAVDMKKVRLSKPPLPGTITIDKVSVRDFTSIGIKWIPTAVVLDNILLNNEDFKIAAARLATSFSFSRIPTEEEIDQNWTVLLDNLLNGEVKLHDLSFSDKDTQVNIGSIKTDYALAGGNHRNFGVAINDLKLQSADIHLDSRTFFLSASLDQNNVLNHVSKKVKDFSLQFPPGLAKDNPFLEKLTALGYNRLAFGVDVNYDYQPDTKSLNLTWDTSAADMGRLQLDLHLTDYKSPPVPVDGSLVNLLNYLEQLQTPAQKASLKGFTARYQDFGLAPRLIKAEAQALGQTPEAFTQGLVGTINGSLALLPLPAALKEQVNAVNRFLLNPQEIQLAVTCKRPVRLKSLTEGSISGLLELLGNTEIKVTAK